MSDTQKIQIIEGDEAKAHLGDPELIQLTNRVNKLEVEKHVGALRHETALRVFMDLRSQGNDQEACDAATQIDPKFFPINHMKMLRENGQIAVAKDGANTIGMVGFEECRFPDAASGRKIYELRRLGVEQKYEGRGVGAQLQRAIFDRVRTMDPQGIIIVEAQHPAVIKICQGMGFTLCTMEEGLRLKFGEADMERWREMYEEMGGTFLRYNPSDAPHP